MEAPKVNKSQTVTRDQDVVWAHRDIPVTEEVAKMYADRLRKYPLENPDAKTITEFYLAQGLSKNDYYKLVHRYPFLKEEHDICLLRLGERLWSKAVDNKANWNAVKHRLWSYSPDFNEDDKHAAETKEGSQQQGNITVQLIQPKDTGIESIEERKAKLLEGK